MAEATVVNSFPSRFFCHECHIEVRPNVPAFTCSVCNSGFIEEMESRPAPSIPQSSTSAATSTDPAARFNEMLNNSFMETLRYAPSNRAGTMWGSTHRYNYNTWQASQTPTRTAEDATGNDSEDEEMRGVAPGTVLHFNTGDQGQHGVHGIINYVIQRLGSDLGGRPFVHFHGNPGDYAWGAGGLDAIISQLLNQLEGTGAPPAQKERIENLPKVSVDQGHVDATLQCSICMDDFELKQVVRKLPCDHLYHSECIIRWLEMHGTCPVCRKDLNGEDTSTDSMDFTTVLPSQITSVGPEHSASSSSSSTSMGPSTSSSTSMDE